MNIDKTIKADLHVHTDISDGSYGLREVLRKAIKKNVTHIGITNHDTVNGLREAVILGKKLGITVISGIEISAYDFKNNKKVHILGYNFDLEGKNIKQICDLLLERRNTNSLKQIDILIKGGYELDIYAIRESARNSGVVYKQHIMEELIDKKYTDSIYSELYYKLFKNNGICAMDIEYIDVFDAVKAIKADGGIAVLAHPGQLNSYELIPELAKVGLDGIEIYHHSHNEEDHKRVREYSTEYDLIMTGGTDYHGEYGSAVIEVGDICTPEESDMGIFV